MIKRHAFSLFAFIGYCFFSSNSFAMEIETASEKGQTSLKNETNSNSIDTKFCSTGQDNSEAYNNFQELYLENLRVARGAIENPDHRTDQDMTEAFHNAYNTHPEGFRTPVKIRELTIHLPHGLTPQKIKGSIEFTPRRKDNPSKMLKGIRGTYVCKLTNEILALEGHHTKQDNTGDIVYLPKKTHRGTGNSRLMHHRKNMPSRIDRPAFKKTKEDTMIHYGTIFSDEIATQEKTLKRTPSDIKRKKEKKQKFI